MLSHLYEIEVIYKINHQDIQQHLQNHIYQEMSITLKKISLI